MSGSISEQFRICIAWNRSRDYTGALPSTKRKTIAPAKTTIETVGAILIAARFVKLP